jgi:putative colanic acid biosynthesis UDP-glucose lipid carrier transferase
MARESSFFDLRPSGDEAGALTRLADVVSVALAYYLPLWFYDPGFRAFDAVAVLLAIVLFGFFANALSLYRGFRGVPLLVEVGRVWGAWALSAAVLLSVGFALKVTQEFSRVVVTTWMFGAPTLVAVVRARARR